MDCASLVVRHATIMPRLHETECWMLITSGCHKICHFDPRSALCTVLNHEECGNIFFYGYSKKDIQFVYDSLKTPIKMNFGQNSPSLLATKIVQILTSKSFFKHG